jgi:trimethylamine---corrinoid protein Co-methyltransferase
MNNASIKLGTLSSVQMDQLHDASLRILDTVGVVVHHTEAVELLRKAGARVEADRVRIPSRLIEGAIKTAPTEVRIHDRSGEPAMTLKNGNCYFGTGSDCPSTIDPVTGQHRTSTKADVARIARLCDALGNIDFCMSMGIASDASRVTSYVHQFDAMVRNTTKPLVFTAHDRADVQDIFDLALVVLDTSPDGLKAQPRYIHYNEPISPLFHTPEGLGKLLFCAEYGIPMIYIGSPMMGASAPVTMAGCIAQANAEALSGLVIHQLKCAGAPFIYGADASMMDMATMIYAYGAPEMQIMDIAFADLARRYGLPLFCIAGATDAKVLDAQAGSEMAVSLLISALNGCSLIHDVGYLESGMCCSQESILLADELIGMAKRYLAGFEITDDTLAMNVIERVGPRGNFLSETHTLENFRRDAWFPRFMDRRNFSAWTDDGAEPVSASLQRKAMKILKEHHVAALEPERLEKMNKILTRRG